MQIIILYSLLIYIVIDQLQYYSHCYNLQILAILCKICLPEKLSQSDSCFLEMELPLM